MFLTFIMWTIFITTGAQTTDIVPVTVTFEEEVVETVSEEPIIESDICSEVEIVEPVMVSSPIPEETLSEEEIELIALVTMAEAEGEPEEGKRLVIDTILNRVDSSQFPDTVNGVIYQPNQFEAMWNGRVNRCYVMEEICQLVREELRHRTNYDVVFFTAGGYGRYGTPLFQVANHYFCEA